MLPLRETLVAAALCWALVAFVMWDLCHFSRLSPLSEKYDSPLLCGTFATSVGYLRYMGLGHLYYKTLVTSAT